MSVLLALKIVCVEHNKLEATINNGKKHSQCGLGIDKEIMASSARFGRGKLCSHRRILVAVDCVLVA